MEIIFPFYFFHMPAYSYNSSVMPIRNAITSHFLHKTDETTEDNRHFVT